MRTAVGLGLLGWLLLAGCTKPPPPAPVEVKGRLLRGGKPLTHMVVTLHPREDQNKNNRPIAAVDPKSGQFQLQCVPGRYKVTVAPIPVQQVATPAGGDDGNAGQQPASVDPRLVPSRYRDAESSPWEITVATGNSDEIVLTVD
jgi:hypothetical protein